MCKEDGYYQQRVDELKSAFNLMGLSPKIKPVPLSQEFPPTFTVTFLKNISFGLSQIKDLAGNEFRPATLEATLVVQILNSINLVGTPRITRLTDPLSLITEEQLPRFLESKMEMLQQLNRPLVFAFDFWGSRQNLTGKAFLDVYATFYGR